MKRETKEKLCYYADMVRYYLFRPLRAYLFYMAFRTASLASIYVLPDSDPEIVGYHALRFHLTCSFSILIVFAFMTGLFVLYDPMARRRFVRKKKDDNGMFSEHLGVIMSYDFWCDLLGLMIMPAVMREELFSHILYVYFRLENFSFWQGYGLYLLTILPIFAVIQLLFRVRTREFWRELSEKDTKGIHGDAAKLGLFYLLILFGYSWLGRFYLPMIPTLISLIKKPAVLAAIAAILLFLALYSRLRAFRIRRKFFRMLKKTCRENDFALSKITHPYLSILTKDKEFHFTVKAYGKTYACKLLAATSRSAQMVFFHNGEGVYRKMLSIRGVELPISMFKKKFYYEFDEGGMVDHKVLIVSPAPHTILIEGGNRTYFLDNGASVNGNFLYAGQAFLNALNRNCIGVSER